MSHNVTHITLPPVNDTDGTGAGWFAGRNAALSQVESDYFFWMDDDFNFKDKEHVQVLEKLFEVIEESEFDIVAGSSGADTQWNSMGRFWIQPGKDGACTDQVHGSYGTLPNFPQCFV